MRPLGGTLIAIATMRACLGALVLVSLTYTVPYAEVICLVALAMAQLSDHLDGWLARRFSRPSVAGYLQDSISDKLFHAGCLLGLQERFDGVGVIFWGLLVREFILLATRVLTAEVGPSLARLRRYSVLYAVLVRLGILSLFLSPMVGSVAVYAATVGYVLLSGAVVFGTIGWVAALRPSR